MNTDVRDKWVTALRSGEYTQGRGALHSGDDFCCLGVLCEIAVKEGVIPAPAQPNTSPWFSYGDEEDTQTLTLPVSVYGWAGLDSSSPSVPAPDEWVDTSEDGSVKLETLNDTFPRDADSDGHPYSFDDIATLIEENL